MKDYVKVFRGHDVPYGATKYQEDTERFHESFWDNDGNVWVIGICEKWVKASFTIPESLIELPKQPELDIKWGDAPTDTAVWIVDNRGDIKSNWYDKKGDLYYSCQKGNGYWLDNPEITIHHRPEQPMPSKAEWMPEVGEECIVSYPYEDGNFKCFDGEKVLIISFGRCEMTSEYVYTGHSTKHGYVALSAKGYRPLKTEEEKKRESLFELMRELQPISTPSVNDVLDHYTNTLIDAGFTAPEGE